MRQRLCAGVILVGVVLLGRSVSAQVDCPVFQVEPRCNEHEIDVNLLSWINVGFKGSKGDAGDLSYVNGVLYKLHCRQNVLRVGLDIFRYSFEEGERPSGDAPYPWYHYAEGNYKTFDARLGYERRLAKRKLQPFVAIDVDLRYVKKEGTFEGFGDFGPPYSYSGAIRSHSEQLLIALLSGLNYRPAMRFSLSVEASCTVGFSKTTDEVTGLVNRDHLVFGNPFRTISLNYHF